MSKSRGHSRWCREGQPARRDAELQLRSRQARRPAGWVGAELSFDGAGDLCAGEGDLDEAASEPVPKGGCRSRVDTADGAVKGNLLDVTRNYSSALGKLVAQRDGLEPSYRLTGQEIYVRAKVISTKLHPN